MYFVFCHTTSHLIYVLIVQKDGPIFVQSLTIQPCILFQSSVLLQPEIRWNVVTYETIIVTIISQSLQSKGVMSRSLIRLQRTPVSFRLINHFFCNCMGDVCVLRQPANSCCVVPFHLHFQLLAKLSTLNAYRLSCTHWFCILQLINVSLTGSTCNTGLSLIELNIFLLKSWTKYRLWNRKKENS